MKRAGVEELRDECIALACSKPGPFVWASSLLAQALLRQDDALREYGRHYPSCESLCQYPTPETRCTCGLDAALLEGG